MRRYISIVLALVFMMTMLPANAAVQITSESLISQVQSFNEENGVIPSTGNNTEASAEQGVAYQTVPVVSGTSVPIHSENVSDIRNYEDEIIETIPVSNSDDFSKEENSSSYEQSRRESFMQREFAKIGKQLDEQGSFSGEFDWYAEDFYATEPEEENEAEVVFGDYSEELPDEAFDDVIEDTPAEEQEDVVEDIPAEETEDIIEDVPSEEAEEEQIIADEDASDEITLMVFGEETNEEALSGESEDIAEEVATFSLRSTVSGSVSNSGSGGGYGGSGGSGGVIEEEIIPDIVCTVSGKVTLPSSASIAEGSNMNIYAYKAPVIRNGRVIKEPTVYWRRYVTLSSGQRSISFSTELPAGNYIFGVEFLTGNKAISNQTYYYTADGLTLNEYVAEVIRVRSNTSDINMSVPKAESYISGTLNLSNCVPTATNNWVYINAYSEDDINYSYHDARILVPSGTRSMNYEIGLPVGAYEVAFRGNFFDYGYYSSGTLSRMYKYRSTILTEDGLDDLDVMVPSLEDDTDYSYDEYIVTINFDNELEVDKEYLIALIRDDGEFVEVYAGYSMYPDEGDTSITAEFYIDSDVYGDLYVAYKEICGDWSEEADYTFHYYSESLGIVPNIREATVINGEYDIVVNEPDTASIYGDVIVDGGIELTGYAYVGAEFADGIFYDAVDLTDGSYTIYVPTRYIGEEFEMFFARSEYGRLSEEYMVYGDEIYIFEGDQSIDVNAGKHTVLSGMIYLPDSAPSNGANACVNVNSLKENYIIMPGESVLEYNFPKPSVVDDYSLYAYLSTYEPFNSTAYTYENGWDFYFEETATVSGTVSLPEDMTFDKDVNIEIGLSGSYRQDAYCIRTFLAGQSEISYSAKYPMGQHIDQIFVYINDETIPVCAYSYEYEDTVEGDITFDIQLERAKTISGIVTLPEDVVYEGRDFEYCVFAEDSDGRWYETDCYTSNPNGENEFSINIPSDESVTYRVGVYVYNFAHSDETCIDTQSEVFYVSDYVMAGDRYEATPIAADSVIKMYFPVKKCLSGKVLFTDDAFSTGELSAQIYVRNANTGEEAYRNFDDVSVSEDFEYSIYLPNNWYQVTIELDIWENDSNSAGGGKGDEDDYVPVKTNVSLGHYVYDNTRGFIYSNIAPSFTEIDDGLVLRDFTVPKATKVTGKIILPSDFKSTDTLEHIELYFESYDASSQSWGETGFLDSNNNFEAYLPYYISGEYFVLARKPWSIDSNILDKEHYYVDDNDNNIPVTITSGEDISGIEIEYETGYAVSGTISLPQDAEISDSTSINVNVHYGNSSGYVYLDSETRSGRYMLAVPKDNEYEMPLNVGIYTYSNEQGDNPDSNICTGEFYMAADGTLVSSEKDAAFVKITRDMTRNFVLVSGIPITINIERPDNSYSYIGGDVWIEYEDEDGYFSNNQYFSIDNNHRSAATVIVIPKEYDGKDFRLSYRIYQGDVYNSGYVWVNPDGSYSKSYDAAQTHKIEGETSIDITLGTYEQLAKTISGTISFEEGCVLPNGNYTLYVYAYNTTYGVTAQQNIRVTSAKDYDYRITLSDSYSGNYRVSAQLYANDTNVCSTTVYYTSNGITMNRSEATLVAADSTNINIELPRLSKVSGKIVVDENYRSLEDLSQVNVYFRRRSDYSERGFMAYVDEDMNYTAYLPYDFAGDCQVGIRILSDSAMNNLVKGITYWAEDWYTIEHGTDIEDVDIAVETGYTVSGKVKLPDDIDLPKDGVINYTLSLISNYGYLQFDSDTNEAEFMFGVDKDNYRSAYFEGSGSYYYDEPINVYLEEVMYSNDGSVYYDWNSDISFLINEDIEDIELTIPAGAFIKFELDGPSSTYIYGGFTIEEIENDWSRHFSFDYNDKNRDAWGVLPISYLGDTFTVAYECSSSDYNGKYYIPWQVYLNRDGNFYSDIENGSAYVLADENNIQVTIPLAEDVIYPEAILQSAHPYKSNTNETYTYTYEGEDGEEADSLMITFSENTETESYYDYIYIIDENGVQTSYSGISLSGATIAVPGNSFTIRLTSDGGSEYFGFAITDVRPVVTHTVTFKNYDGTVLETAMVLDGQSAVYNGLTPEKPAEGEKKYRFIGWDKELSNITADTEFTALFEEVIIYIESQHPYGNDADEFYSYKHPEEVDALRITFSENTETEGGWDYIYIEDANGNRIGTYSGLQLAGASVTVNGSSFTIRLTSDGSVTRYGFEVVGIAPVKEFYTVTFQNYDGTELSKISVPAGGTAVYDGETPTKVVDGYVYEFIGWNKSLTSIYSDLVVTAQYRLVEYVTVSYYNYDNTLLYTDRVLKGEASEYRGVVPFKPVDDNGIGYVFSGWNKDLDEVYSNTIVVARFARRSVKRITTEAELRAMENDLDGVYVLENDIELTSAWTPVGAAGESFSGVFDGNGYSIKNITFDVESYSNIGFFDTIHYAVLRNLNLEVAIGSEYSVYQSFVAPLAINAYFSDIRNVHIKGSIDFADNNVDVAGFADTLEYSYVDGSSANVDMSTSGSLAGFVSTVFGTDISNSYYSGTMTTGYDSVNIVGFTSLISDGTASSSFEACYSNATLVGAEDTYVEQITPFVVVPVDAVGVEVTAENCYYNKDTFTLDSQDDSEDLITLGTGLTDEQMKSEESFVGFDFGMIWEMDENGNLTLSAAGGRICDEHSFTEWEQISEVTCETDGVSTRRCTRCGRVERNVTPSFGHSFGQWTIVKEADVLSEGEKIRECSVCYTTEVELIEKIAIDLNDPNYGFVRFNVVDAVTLAPISNAQIFISTDNDGENTFFTDENGNLTQVLPIGIVNVSIYKSGYLTRTVKIDVVSGEQDVPTIGISNKPLVDVQLSSKVMSYDEIINAGIDVNAPGNNHVVKYNVTLTFGTESADVVTYFNGNHSCVGNTRIPVHLSTGTVYVYPVSETFYLMVYGEVQWLKEMFDVEMLIMNNSNTDIVTECTAELILPDGLSLAEMKEEQQTLVQNVDDIGHSESHSVHWYVRGDTAGEYNIGANLKAVLSPLGDVIDQHYTLEEPIKVYAGNAMHMDIYVPDMTFYGDSYPIKIELTNVSDRTLYNVSNSIKYFKEGKVTHYSNGMLVNETYFTEDTLASIGSSEFKPGDKISIEVQADIEFRTSLIRTGLDEIKKYVGNIDNLLNAYEAYLTGAKVVNDSYLTLNNIKKTMEDIITTKAYEGTDAEAANALYAAVSDFTELVKVAESQKAVDLFNKLKTTGVYKLLTGICENGDVFASYRANRISKFVNTITAIIKSENITPANAVSEEMLFELLRRAIESIPVKYYLEDVLVSTLEGSTTSIPYTVHILSSEERFSSIDRLDSYLNSVIETALGHIDSPWLMSVLADGSTTYDDAEDVIFVNGTVNKFAASDNVGDVEFKAWTSADSTALEITCTNENAVTENGVLSFVGPGYISVKALEPGSGTLYIQMNDEIREYHFTAVDAHTCEATDAITIISPDADTEGYMISLCDICHSIMAVDKHESACENHAYGEYTVEMDANGEELGIKHRTCVECGHIQYLVIDESIDYMEFILTPESKLDIIEKDTGDGNYLKKVVAGLTAEQITSNFDNTNIEVILPDGTAVSATSKIGTGNKLVINSEDGTTSSELTVVVKGDTTGDGNFNILDMIKVFNHVADEETKPLTGDFVEAAYINSDRNINILDLILMFNAIQNGEVLR